MRVRPLFVAVLLVFAGCSSVLGSGSDEPVETFTPVPVPTDEPTPTPGPPLPPGVTEVGFENPEVLVRAHVAMLEDTSYTFHRLYTERYANGTLRARIETDVRVPTNRSHFYYIHNMSGSAARVQAGTNTIVAANGSHVRVAIYADGVRMLRAITRDGSTTYGIVRNDIGAPYGPQYADLPYNSGLSFREREMLSNTFQSTSEVTVERIDNSTNTTLYRIRAVRGKDTNFSAIVDSRGVIHSYRLGYTRVVNRSTIRVTESIRFTDIGSTTVERPPWYDEAIAATNATTNRTTPMTEETTTTNR